jgi:hypothetical protein
VNAVGRQMPPTNVCPPALSSATAPPVTPTIRSGAYILNGKETVVGILSKKDNMLKSCKTSLLLCLLPHFGVEGWNIGEFLHFEKNLASTTVVL